ncbi:ubiquitin carboxyl-terminal hydrolase 37-like isoform X3, partial [Lates japonicus]
MLGRKLLPSFYAFKRAVALWAPEFGDHQQKDAHEFLTAVLDQIRYWGPQLQVLTAGMGIPRNIQRDHEVMDMYVMQETELEYRCECGATKSGQCSSFATLPRVLVLHLKRFRYTPTFQLEKIHDPVDLQRELVVSSGQDGACYSLVSTINHIGATARSGHYICDGVDPDVGPVDLTDRWFTYNDTVVTQTSSVNVCNQRQRSSYVLFYRRQVRG